MKKEIKISDIKCEKCVATIKNALEKIEDIKKIEISLDNKTALIESLKEIDDKVLKDTIENMGFNVLEINKK